nr:transposase domain-containing protein [Paenibacillus harenae]
METAKENGLNPFKYLVYLFEQLPQLSLSEKTGSAEHAIALVGITTAELPCV